MFLLTKEQIEKKFIESTEFNELFDAFQSAIEQKIDDIDLYRNLFWNESLGIDEIKLFGEKLVETFPEISFEVFIWIANVFEALFGEKDNLEQAFNYYKKASLVNPTSEVPFLEICKSYNQDLNIPPINNIIEFLKSGIELVNKKGVIYKKLSDLYFLKRDSEMAKLYLLKAEEFGERID